MRNQDRIRKAIRPALNLKQDIRGNWPGQLGDGFGHLNVTGRNLYVYCRVAGQVQEVLCRRIPVENDLLVNVGYADDEPELYQVLSVRGLNPGGTTGGAITGYAPSIRYRLFYPGGGQDPLYVEGKQFLPGLVMPYSGMSVRVYQNVIWVGGNDFVSLNTQSVNLTSHIPSTIGKAALVLLTVNDTGTVVATKGSEVDLADLGLDDLPAIPTDTVNVLAAVRVYYGQTAVQEARNNTDIIDLRFSGWGAGGSSHDPVTVADTVTIDMTVTDQEISAALKDTTVTPGQYNYPVITVDQQGRITAAASGSGQYSAANAATALTTPTYDGSGQTVHPDVYYNAAGWHGYKYWMAMTPFPNANAAYENPSILASNDGNTWVVPDGLTNPVQPAPGSYYWSDPDITVTPDGSTMWMVYRWAGSSDVLHIRSSTDGVTWSANSGLITWVPNSMLSPTVVWDGTQYVMWTVNITTSTHELHRRTCSTFNGTWSSPTICTVNNIPAGQDIWHIDVVKRGNRYDAFICTVNHSDHGGGVPIYFLSSDDGLTWTFPDNPILSPAAGSWDGTQLYRASGIVIDAGYDLFYSAASGTTFHIGRTTLYFPVGTVSEIDTGTGLTGGPITTTGTISLDDTAVTPGEYTNPTITVDQQGRITAASNGDNIGGGKYTQFITTVSGGDFTFIKDDGGNPVTAQFDLE